MTHNTPFGFLGGFVSAYFVYLAINNIHIYKWPLKLMRILKKSDILKKYIDKNNETEYNKYIIVWDNYIS